MDLLLDLSSKQLTQSLKIDLKMHIDPFCTQPSIHYMTVERSQAQLDAVDKVSNTNLFWLT